VIENRTEQLENNENETKNEIFVGTHARPQTNKNTKSRKISFDSLSSSFFFFPSFLFFALIFVVLLFVTSKRMF